MNIDFYEDNNPEYYHKLAKEGVANLVIWQMISRIFTFIGGIILSRILSPVDFGIFGITTFVVGTVALFGRFGLGPSLIRKKKQIELIDLQTGFTLQQILMSIVVLILWISAPIIVNLYKTVPSEAVILIRVIAFNLFLNTWRSMSVLLLDRNMRYKTIAILQLSQKLIYQIVAVVFAVFGYGVWSLIWAVLLRSVIGTILTYYSAPWKISFRLNLSVARRLIRFGIPFQFQVVIASIRGWVTPMLVGGLIGPAAVGFVTWANKRAKIPTQIFGGSVARVSFSHFSRLQDYPEILERKITQYINYQLPIFGFWFILILLMGKDLVLWIYTDKWLPAFPALLIFSAIPIFSIINGIGNRALNAIGYVKYATKITFFMTLLFVIMSVLLVYKIGFIAIPISSLIISIISIPLVFRKLKMIDLYKIILSVRWVFVAMAFAGFFGLLIYNMLIKFDFYVILTIPFIVIIYGSAIWILGPDWIKKRIINYYRKIYAIFRNKIDRQSR